MGLFLEFEDPSPKQNKLFRGKIFHDLERISENHEN